MRGGRGRGDGGPLTAGSECHESEHDAKEVKAKIKAKADWGVDLLAGMPDDVDR